MWEKKPVLFLLLATAAIPIPEVGSGPPALTVGSYGRALAVAAERAEDPCRQKFLEGSRDQGERVARFGKVGRDPTREEVDEFQRRRTERLLGERCGAALDAFLQLDARKWPRVTELGRVERDHETRVGEAAAAPKG